MRLAAAGELKSLLTLKVQSQVPRRGICAQKESGSQLNVEQPAFGVWDSLGDRSMSCGVGARATSDWAPNWWLQEVLLVINQDQPLGSDLTFLQRGVVQSVELVCAHDLEEPAVGRIEAIVGRSDSDEGQDS